MANPAPRRFPFDDDDPSSGSVRPLSQADLQAILGRLTSDDSDELQAGTGADRPVVAVRVRASVGQAGRVLGGPAVRAAFGGSRSLALCFSRWCRRSAAFVPYPADHAYDLWILT
jgi:hypothetical protein